MTESPQDLYLDDPELGPIPLMNENDSDAKKKAKSKDIKEKLKNYKEEVDGKEV